METYITWIEYCSRNSKKKKNAPMEIKCIQSIKKNFNNLKNEYKDRNTSEKVKFYIYLHFRHFWRKLYTSYHYHSRFWLPRGPAHYHRALPIPPPGTCGRTYGIFCPHYSIPSFSPSVSKEQGCPVVENQFYFDARAELLSQPSSPHPICHSSATHPLCHSSATHPICHSFASGNCSFGPLSSVRGPIRKLRLLLRVLALEVFLRQPFADDPGRIVKS